MSRSQATLTIDTAQEMEEYGATLGPTLARGTVVYLNGALGAGKTTLARGILRGKGYAGTVPSPTFTLVEHYGIGEDSVTHIDLYRIMDDAELEYLSIRDYVDSSNVLLVEWAERARSKLPAPDLEIDIEFNPDGTRTVKLLCLTGSTTNFPTA